VASSNVLKVGETNTSAGTTGLMRTAAKLPLTMLAGDEMEQLMAAAHNMALSQPPVEFASRFLFTNDMVVGGQGLVVFARGRDAGMRQFAIKCAMPTLRLCYKLQPSWWWNKGHAYSSASTFGMLLVVLCWKIYVMFIFWMAY
jgi:hypothetical protein